MMPQMPQMNGPNTGIPVAGGPPQAQPMAQDAVGLSAAPLTLPDDEAKELTKTLTQAIEYHNSTVRPLHDKLAQWLEMFSVIAKEKTKPWKGASNFPVPFIAEKIMSIHARLVRAIFNVDPIWIVKPRIPDYEMAQQVERFVDYLVDRGGYRRTLDLAILYALLEGTAIVKVDYKRVTRSVTSSNPEIAGKFGTLTGVNQETFTEFEGPRALFVPLRDFVVLPIDRFDLDEIQGAGHKFFISKSALLARGKAGVYANAEEVVEKKATGQQTSIRANPIFGDIAPVPQEVLEQYELYELFWKYDINGDGEEEPVIITFSKEANMLLRVVPFPYEHGKAPYVAIRPIPQPNLFYGTALAQYLEPIQRELTASFQRRGDALARSTMPPILRVRGSAWNPNEEPLQPAGVITVNDPGEITSLQLPDFRQSNVMYEQMLIMFGERLTGISDYQLGRSAGSNRTFGEVRSILSEGEVRIDVMLARIHEDMKRLAELTFDIAYQFMPYGGLMNVGQQFFKVTREMMRPPGIGFEAYEFVPNGTLSEASKEQILERTLVIAQQFINNPLLGNPQVNQYAPLVMALLMKKILIAAGWQDWEQFLPQIAEFQMAAQQGQPNPLQQQMAQQQQMQAQQQEQQMALEQAKVGAVQQNAQSNQIKAVMPMLQQMMQGGVGASR